MYGNYSVGHILISYEFKAAIADQLGEIVLKFKKKS